MSRRKNQRIPDSIWRKLERIQAYRPWWSMTAVINECLEIGANWYLKGIRKKENSGDQPELHERTDTNIAQKDPSIEAAVKIARTKTYDFDN